MQKRIFSGVQPTGNIHIGTYLGALRNWVQLQNEYESFFCVVNLHAITIKQDPAELLKKTRDVARVYIAAGVDPSRSTIFVQSHVKEHAELAWVLNCVTRVSELDRMTQFKEKGKSQRENTTVGLFDYPVLMASDILLYHTDLVPVGEDQKQHLELTRDIAIRFNRDYGETFRIPEPYISKVGARIMSLDDPTKKMSKSDENQNGSILMLDEPDILVKKIKRAVTDSGTDLRLDPARPAITNLLTIYHLMTGMDLSEVESHFAGKGYGAFKSELADAVVDYLKPFQERCAGISDAELDTILLKGAERAREVATPTFRDVKTRMGLES
jgi:tryptophanyl-tRNA synthetase